ncbi:MAG: dihydrolipoyl dehydrogenase [Oscillospiraceae bacterium]|jgi:dihydrolipoamide dehydrogenase|nr:dihydrolipoyl dehydrogenase [Oscillospiraceae bacterium]
MEQFDLCIIGGGPAGYTAAGQAGAGGLKTALIEKRALGGVCLNEGCIPSKTFLHSAKILDYAKTGDKYGVTVTGAGIDQGKVIQRKNKVIKVLVAGIKAKLNKAGVTMLSGTAVITGRETSGFIVTVDDTPIQAQHILLASGSAPVIPPIPGVKEGIASEFVLTNREILDLTDIPPELVVVGGGVIGLEMASYYNSAGSKVTVIEMLDKIAGLTENEISRILLGNYKKKGVAFKLGCRVTGIGENSVSYEENGVAQTISADKVLLSIGRAPNTQGLGLENIGVLTERGAVITDNSMRTNVPGVYAAGDVNGKSMLAHTAYREAEVAVAQMLGGPDTMRYNAIPSVIYTNPEVAGVGETEESAREKGLDIAVTALSMRYSGRYLAEVEGGDGVLRLIVDKKSNRLVGAHMIGSYVSEIIFGAAMMIDMALDIERVGEVTFPHPSVCEVLREALNGIGGTNIP